LARVPEKGLIAANAAFILDFQIGVLTITVLPEKGRSSRVQRQNWPREQTNKDQPGAPFGLKNVTR
jgi:hypothetical protein